MEFTTICQIVKQAYEAALKRIKVGVPVRALDTVAREVITNAGYGPYFTHSLGHGVGLDVHESPHVTTHSEELLKKGMIITIEPGIYLPGKFGVRWENTIVI
ncbi:MAG: M24 family metallopeptidase [bacterium]|nr:M24 family metallopeptidase [bacterium]